MKNNDYKPISCSFYDILEAFATKREMVNIIFVGEEQQTTIQGIISTFQTENKVEYLILQSDQKIRLDTLIEVDGNKLSDYNYC